MLADIYLARRLHPILEDSTWPLIFTT